MDDDDFQFSKAMGQESHDKTDTYSASMQEVEKYNKMKGELKASLSDTSKFCIDEVGFEDFTHNNQNTPLVNCKVKQVSRTNRTKAIKNL